MYVKIFVPPGDRTRDLNPKKILSSVLIVVYVVHRAMADTATEPLQNGNAVSAEEEEERMKQRPADIDAVSIFNIRDFVIGTQALCYPYRILVFQPHARMTEFFPIYSKFVILFWSIHTILYGCYPRFRPLRMRKMLFSVKKILD